MKKYLLVLGMAVLLGVGPGFDVLAQEELAARTEEELLFMEIPVVVTAARYEQPISESPSSVSVITAEDIRLSGANTIADLLRGVAGIDVLMMNAYEIEVSARGFNEMLAHKMLVLIDGQTFYQDFYGMVFWKSLPVALEEIERIEIIRGPGSALYGANAFCGVINIITKKPEDIKGNHLSLRYGEYDSLLVSLIHAHIVNNFSYKVSAVWDEANQWPDKDEDAYRIGKGNIQLNYHLDNTSKLSLINSYNQIKDGELGSGLGAGNFEAKESCTQIGYETKDFKCRTFYRYIDAQTTLQTSDEIDNYLLSTYDMEFQHLLPSIGEKDTIIWGGNYRYNTINKGELIKEDKKQDLWAGFLQDEHKFSDNLTLLLGARYDWHPLTKEHVSPRASLLYSPKSKHTFRVSAATAFRNPAFLDSYLDKDIVRTLSELDERFKGNPLVENLPVTIMVRGREDLKAEKMQSYELGYQSFLNQKAKLRIDLFVNQCQDFIVYSQLVTTERYPSYPYPPKTMEKTTENQGNLLGLGGEIELDLFLTDWLTTTMNYSYQKYTHQEDDLSLDIKKGDREKSMPLHKINVRLRFNFAKNITANLSAHYVDEAQWSQGKADAYTMVDTRVGYSFAKDNGEIFLSAFNLLNNKHYEYAPGSPPLYPAEAPLSDKIGRKLTAGVSYKF